jgi:hypothetical protein
VVLGISRRQTEELRLLDARTGRLRRGPVALGTGGSTSSLVDAGRRVLLRDSGSGGYRTLDPSRPGLLGPAAAVRPGSCGTTCSATTVTVGGAPEPAPRSIDAGSTVTGPDGRLWGLLPGPQGVEDEGSSIVVQATDGGAPSPRGQIGPSAAHGGRAGEMLAVPGGLWVRDAFDGVTWFGADGPGIPNGGFDALGGSGACVWGLADDHTRAPALVRLGQGDAADGPVVSLGAVFPGGGPTPPLLTVAGRTAWVVAPEEQTLVRIPLPPC